MARNRKRNRKGNKNRNRKGLLILASASGTILLGVLVWGLVSLRTEYVGSINGTPITREEYALTMSLNIANITSMYAQEYEAGTPEEFWGTSQKEKKPLAELREKTQSDLVRTYVLLELARDYGLIEDISYDSLKKVLEKENEYRADPERTEPVYGPLHYEFAQYRAYLLSRFTTELVNLMQKDGTISVTEQEVRSAYEEEPMLLGSTDPVYVFWEAQRSADSSGTFSEQEIAVAAEALKNSDTIPIVEGWTVSERRVDEENYREVSSLEPETLGVLTSLEEGEISSCIVVGNNGYIYKLLQREEKKPLPYDEIKSSYQKRLAEEKFENILEEKCSRANVKWKEKKLPMP